MIPSSPLENEVLIALFSGVNRGKKGTAIVAAFPANNDQMMQCVVVFAFAFLLAVCSTPYSTTAIVAAFADFYYCLLQTLLQSMVAFSRAFDSMSFRELPIHSFPPTFLSLRSKDSKHVYFLLYL